jgi:ligand-binding SRPBCC domain-containing protein
MAIYERSVLLQATPGEVYAFHQDPKNITKISPASLRVIRVECQVPARVGEEFCLEVSQFGVPMRWIGFWEAVVPGEALVDGAKKSPFREWRHQHLFRAEGGGCRMTDRVSYALPGGILGRLLDATVMKLIFTIMFSARHRATKAFFKEGRIKAAN